MRCPGAWGTPPSSQSMASSRCPWLQWVQSEMSMKQHPPAQGAAARERAVVIIPGHRTTVPTSNGFVICSFQPTFAIRLGRSTNTHSSAALSSKAK